MRVLALNPYHGGSHAAFLDGWRRHSRHAFDVLTLPAHHWKWRMRHAAVTLAAQVTEQLEAGAAWDAVWCTDMLNLAELTGLAPPAVHRLPRVVYFHENQLTYPVRQEDQRDVHFGLTNLTSAAAADAIWFNSRYHRDELLAAWPDLLRKMPDHPLDATVERIAARASVQYPGIEPDVGPHDEEAADSPAADRPIHLLWASRWEHDKGPDLLRDGLVELARRGIDFRLSVIGEQFREAPHAFAAIEHRFADRIERWGYQPTRPAYLAALREADVFVSTAEHEFFGIAAVEAAAAGCVPVLPRRLAYPEIFADDEAVFYDGSADGLADAVTTAAERVRRGASSQPRLARRIVAQFAWPIRAAALDDALDAVCAPA
jgi:glycosyltransferase involved in cell wall biosynthesis